MQRLMAVNFIRSKGRILLLFTAKEEFSVGEILDANRIQQDRRLSVFPGVTSVSRDCGVRRQGRRILEGGHHTRPAPPNAPSQDSIRTSFGADWAAKGALPAERYRNFESKSCLFRFVFSLRKASRPQGGIRGFAIRVERSTFFLSNNRSRFLPSARRGKKKKEYRHIYISIYIYTYIEKIYGLFHGERWINWLHVSTRVNYRNRGTCACKLISFFFLYTSFFTRFTRFSILRNVVLTCDWHLVNWNCSFSSFFFFFFGIIINWKTVG